MSDNENNAEIESKVLTVLKKIDENISHDDTDIAHELGKSKTNKTPNIVSFVSRRTRNNIYKERRKLKSNAPGKPTSERVFINVNLTKRNKHFLCLMQKEINLAGNTFGPSMEEFFSDKAMTAESLLFEVKKMLNISKTLWTALEIPTKFLQLN